MFYYSKKHHFYFGARDCLTVSKDPVSDSLPSIYKQCNRRVVNNKEQFKQKNSIFSCGILHENFEWSTHNSNHWDNKPCRKWKRISTFSWNYEKQCHKCRCWWYFHFALILTGQFILLFITRFGIVKYFIETGW